MKTTIVILTTLLALNASLIFAHNSTYYAMKAEPVKIEITIDLDKLIPAMQILAEFNDGTEYIAIPETKLMKLAPITPRVADFEENNSLSPVDIEKLAPSTPAEADFLM